MNILNSQSVGKKLAVGFFLVATMILVVAVLGLVNINKVKEVIDSAQDFSEIAQALTQLMFRFKLGEENREEEQDRAVFYRTIPHYEQTYSAKHPLMPASS